MPLLRAHRFQLHPGLHLRDGQRPARRRRRARRPFYAGLLVSAYAVAEALTAMGWGALSDRVGRKPVVLAGLGGVALSSLLFGLSTNYWVALLARFVGGALNGNVAVMQTMVAEMVKVPEHEPKAYATQPFVWTLGGIIGSAMGGFLAQPARFYPDLFPADGLFGRYPYLLPNLVAVAVVVLAIVQGLFFLEETNPRSARKANAAADNADDGAAVVDDDDADQRGDRGAPTLLLVSTSLSRPQFIEEGLPVPVQPNFDLRRSSFGTVHAAIRVGHGSTTTAATDTNAEVMREQQQEAAEGSGSSNGLRHAAADAPPGPARAGLFSGGGRLDLRGGLGYTVHDVGVYLPRLPPFVDRVGVWRSFVAMVVLYPLAYIVMPFVSAFPGGGQQSAFVYLALVLQSVFGIIAIPCALILLKDATPSPRVLGRVNGAAMSGCCLARTVGPPLVGVIYAAGGSAAAWFSCAGCAVLGVVQLGWVPRSRQARDLVAQVEDGGGVGKVDRRQQ
ncbi:TCR1-like protein [Apiospora phragmitis]|uniref:TCR1-like protein n=1 Tax=Apiospora phragmitis TaxID=2905665 RepID=A0ABR1V271_9PEZI